MQAVAERRLLVEQQKRFDYEMWQQEQSRDSRLAPLRLMIEDTRMHGEVTAPTWGRVKNEKYSRAAERLKKKTFHQRPDYYDFDSTTGDIIITEATATRPRYTFRQMYGNGLQDAHELAERDPRFAFQKRRDEIFMQTYELVEAMLHGETNFDTIKMVSTFPVEELVGNQQAVKEKFYDGSQFLYTFRRQKKPTGGYRLEMDATVLRCPDSDLTPDGTTYGMMALAEVQRRNGVDIPFTLVSSHEQNAFVATLNTEGTDIKDLVTEDVRTYDDALKEFTGNEFDHGYEQATLDAYKLFDMCPSDWAAYFGYHELLAKHLAGQPMDNRLRDHMLNLLSSYRALGKYNTTVDEATFNTLFEQAWVGRLTANMQLAANELLDYAHSALMEERLKELAQTGSVTQAKGDVLVAYAASSGGANGAAVAEGRDYDDCETGTGVGDVGAAMAMAAREGISLDEAMRRIATKQANERARIWSLGECIACLKATAVAVLECKMCLGCETVHKNEGDTGLDRIMREARAKQKAKRAAGNMSLRTFFTGVKT